MKSLFRLIFCLVCFVSVAHAALPPIEHIYGWEQWKKWDGKAKEAFVTGFWLGSVYGKKDGDDGVLRMKNGDLQGMIVSLEAFYAIPENQPVYLQAAIQACLMEKAGKPKEEIQKVIREGRVTKI